MVWKNQKKKRNQTFISSVFIIWEMWERQEVKTLNMKNTYKLACKVFIPFRLWFLFSIKKKKDIIYFLFIKFVFFFYFEQARYGIPENLYLHILKYRFSSGYRIWNLISVPYPIKVGTEKLESIPYFTVLNIHLNTTRSSRIWIDTIYDRITCSLLNIIHL